MEWENVPDDLENWFGFVYLIERLNAKDKEKKYYWGCKMLKKTIKLKPLKGFKRKRKKICESDWKDYYGSSEELKKDVEKHGKENFKRKILKLCTCKWQLKYEEIKIQIENNVLFRDDTYNGILNVRINRPPKNLKTYYQNMVSCVSSSDEKNNGNIQNNITEQ
jgi:hypothetical protein